jgi:hypothetical protein
MIVFLRHAVKARARKIELGQRLRLGYLVRRLVGFLIARPT